VKFLNAWVIYNNRHTIGLTVGARNIFRLSTAVVKCGAVPLELLNHTEYLYTYSSSIQIINKTPYWAADNAHIMRKLITLNTKQGLKLKASKLFCLVLQQLHNYFVEFRRDIYAVHPAYNMFFGFSREFPNNFYKPDFLIRYIYLYLELIFLIKRVKPRKKKKKKTYTEVVGIILAC
jgi:hypothetical protein